MAGQSDAKTPNIIEGWEALYSYTLLNDQLLRRAIGLYGFPRPQKLRRGSILLNAWDKNEVLDWMIANQQISFVKKALLLKAENHAPEVFAEIRGQSDTPQPPSNAPPTDSKAPANRLSDSLTVSPRWDNA